MSWDAPIAPGSAALFSGRAKAAFEAYFTERRKVVVDGKETEEIVYRPPAAEVKEQFERALAAALHLLPAVQPDQDGKVAGRLSGHANPGHKPAPGITSDAINISVYVPDASA